MAGNKQCSQLYNIYNAFSQLICWILRNLLFRPCLVFLKTIHQAPNYHVFWKSLVFMNEKQNFCQTLPICLERKLLTVFWIITWLAFIKFIMIYFCAYNIGIYFVRLHGDSITILYLVIKDFLGCCFCLGMRFAFRFRRPDLLPKRELRDK